MEAENRFQLTKSLFLEGSRLVTSQSYKKTARIGILILLGAWVVLLVIALASSQSPWLALGEAPIVALMAVWLVVVLPRSRAKRAFRALEAQSGGDMERITRFYPEELEALAGAKTKRVSYGEVEKVLRSRHLLVLMCQDKTGIMLALDGFTQGSPEQVMALIRAGQEAAKADEADELDEIDGADETSDVGETDDMDETDETAGMNEADVDEADDV